MTKRLEKYRDCPLQDMTIKQEELIWNIQTERESMSVNRFRVLLLKYGGKDTSTIYNIDTGEMDEVNWMKLENARYFYDFLKNTTK